MPFILKKMFVSEKQRAFLFFIKELSYTQKEAQRFIARGRLLINGEVMDISSQEIEGEIEFIYFEPISRGLKPHIEHEQFVVFDKPSGLLIHPQNKHTPYSLIDELKFQFGRDANIAHRIDQETSGLVLCSKNKKSERDIKMMFQEREMKKKYLALVHGEIKADICIEAPLLRREDDSAIVRMVVKVHAEGKESKTDIKPLNYFAEQNMTLVECSPLTGRQHQIRVHLFHIGHPIVGDPIYGQSEDNVVNFLDRELSSDERIKSSGASRLLLHANELEFELYDENFHIRSDVNFVQICFQSMKS